MDIIAVLSQELSVSKTQIESAVKLMDEGNTIPFIARYRKEVTGGLDDTILRNLEERLHYLRNLEKRKQEVLELIAASGKLDDKQMEQMQKALEEAKMLSEVEDLYRPYKQKRKTRASVAREKGLEPLAKFMLMQKPGGDLEQEAARYVNAEKGVEDVEQALSGAGDILAEEISDSAQIRSPFAGIFAEKRPNFDNKRDKRKSNIRYVFRIQRIGTQNSVPSHSCHRPRRTGRSLESKCGDRPAGLCRDDRKSGDTQKFPFCKGTSRSL